LSQVNIERETTDEKIIKELISMKQYLENRIKEIEDELEKLKLLLRTVEEAIVSKSFKEAEKISASKEDLSPIFKEQVPLKTSQGKLLATIHIGGDEARIVPDETLTFKIITPPFQTFLINRILEQIRIKDDEDSKKGKIFPNQRFTYKTVTDEENIKEIVIRNYKTKKRLREIISSVRWTLDKMYQKK